MKKRISTRKLMNGKENRQQQQQKKMELKIEKGKRTFECVHVQCSR